jgi:hypothetical protein
MAATKDTEAKVEFLSVWTNSGDLLVQTNPKHDITDLNCTNDYWLVLDKSELGYEPTLSILLSAQVTQKTVVFRAEDVNGEFCRLSRVTAKKS